MHPAGDDVLDPGIQNPARMGMGPLGGPYQGLAPLRLDIKIIVRKIRRPAILNIVQIRHPGKDAM